MKRIGKQTVRLSEGVTILSAASTVGPKEAEGPLGKYFDQKTEDSFFGEKSWELAESKYTFKDMSSKKKYASVPVLMKIKGERKFKHALELIVLMCEEKLGLQKKKVVETVDYKLPYMNTEELVNAGYVKKMVAAIPLNDEAAPATEDVPAAASAEENENA